jgi:hypothetical protein
LTLTSFDVSLVSLDTFRIRPFTFLGRPTAAVVSAARHLSSKPEDGKQCSSQQTRTAVSFHLHDLIYLPLYALLWNSRRNFLDIDINARTAQTVTQFLLQGGNARCGMKLTNGRVLKCASYSCFLHLLCANQTAQSSKTPSICRQNHHIARSLHQRTTPMFALPAHTRNLRRTTLCVSSHLHGTDGSARKLHCTFLFCSILYR